MSLIIKAKTSAEHEARWFEYQDGISFKVAPIDRSEYRIGLERARRIIERKESGLGLDSLGADSTDRTELDIQTELMGRYLIVDWKGSIRNEAGEAVRHSTEAAIALLKSEPKLVSWVSFKSVEVAVGAQQEAEEIVGKPSPDSDGNASGQGKGKSES